MLIVTLTVDVEDGVEDKDYIVEEVEVEGRDSKCSKRKCLIGMGLSKRPRRAR